MTIEQILEALNRERTRATYGAVGQMLGIPPRSVGRLLGERRPEASWVVANNTKQPSYAQRDKHSELEQSAVVITTAAALLELRQRGSWPVRSDAPAQPADE